MTLALVSFCNKTPQLASIYKGSIETINGTNHFPIYIQQDEKEPNKLSAYVVNGLDTARFTRVNFMGPRSILLSFEHYDSHILAEIQPDGSWKGNWKKRLSGGVYDPVEFSAEPVVSFERYPNHNPSSTSFEGEWQVEFTDPDGKTYPATGVFHHTQTAFYGTFLTETGDYRFLEGVATDSTFIISDFDGGHAFRFNAQLNQDGTLNGVFISRAKYKETFTAKRGDTILADAYLLTELTSPNAKMEFSFPDETGKLVSFSDEKFNNKPTLVYLFGSWCPNCADESKMLRELYEKKFKDTDLQIVGIAFEYSGEFESDAEMISIYRKRFNIPWTTIIAGNNDKVKAAQHLPFVKEIKSYPTSFFVGRDGAIQFVHTGFKGPGTGTYYLKEKQDYINHLNAIIN